jgi:phage repressor protein C with HTH and peptisase S24 domain
MEYSEVDRRRRVQSARLKQARISAGFKSARAAALRFHWKPETYNKHENGERGIGRAARKYAKAFRVDERWLLGLQDDGTSKVRGIPVVGEAAIGRWQDVDIAAVIPDRNVTAPQRAQDDDERFAIKLADASMDKEFPKGSYAICVNLVDDSDPTELVVGDIVWIERTRGALQEKTLRRVMSITNGTLRLATISTDPRLRQELTFPARPDEAIRFIGKVVGKYVDYAPA